MQNVILKGKKVTIRTIEESDIKTLWNLVFKEENPEWKKWDAPYFPFSIQEYPSYKEKMQIRLQEEPLSNLIIEHNGRMIGKVVFYWEHKPTRWLEMGIVIYDPAYWNGGYGTE
ncbi:GNAT family N-acetyltransferase, partial [Bacillus luti]|uniref:GNAT family N-acetyltransferase n=1 Tax=Bacillus luti TaxID=2026191 RepID=UPI00289714BF